MSITWKFKQKGSGRSARAERNDSRKDRVRDILTLFALLRLCLASIGIYGVIARTMAQRTNEFAIRFALDARARDVSRLVLASGVKMAFLGSAIGLIGALGVTHILSAWNSGMQLNRTSTVLGTTVS